MVKWVSTKSGRKKRGSARNRKVSKSNSKDKQRDKEKEVRKPDGSRRKSVAKKKEKKEKKDVTTTTSGTGTGTSTITGTSARVSKDRRKSRSKGKTKRKKKGSKSTKAPSPRPMEVPKNVQVKTREIDEEKVKTLLAKLKQEKENPSRVILMTDLDAKAKILLDRKDKKPYPLRYVTRSKKSKEALLGDETSSFFRPSVPAASSRKESSASIAPQEDSYGYAPKLEQVLKLPDENVYVLGTDIPKWAETLEPTFLEMRDVDPPISVGSEHVEAYHNKEFVLRTLADTSLVLDEYQPMKTLTKRDEVHFHPHLVFSNTLRSLINIQQGGNTQSTSTSSPNQEEIDNSGGKKTHFVAGSPIGYIYSRINPIQSAHEIKLKTQSTTTTTTTEAEN